MAHFKIVVVYARTTRHLPVFLTGVSREELNFFISTNYNELYLALPGPPEIDGGGGDVQHFHRYRSGEELNFFLQLENGLAFRVLFLLAKV